MLRVRRVRLWFAIAGIAVALQGCWENDEDQLTLLGDGGCRTADGREGEHTVVSQASHDACKAQCFVANEPCTAVEFNSNNGNCEVHSEQITKYEKVEGVACYVMK
jgi:PAN domain